MVTSSKNTTILTKKPVHHITIGVNDIMISSKSKTRKIIQKTKNRNDTGSTLTLNESNPHSNKSVCCALVESNQLINIIILGTIKEIVI
jgi:hypothetical protein